MVQHCSCGVLENVARSGNSPIRFDEARRRYYIASTSGYSVLLIRFCPFCGGMPPSSDAIVDNSTPLREGYERLNQLLSKVKTIKDSFELLGRPDEIMTVSSPKLAQLQVQTDLPEQYLYYRQLDANYVVVVAVKSGSVLHSSILPEVNTVSP
jgi:hypothetical protein